jgi:branched-chain amino acid transport system substrate-binding protein
MFGKMTRICAGALLTLLAFSPAAAGTKEIVFGIIAPMTGSKAEQGMQFKEGAEVAVAEINAAGGVLGRKIRIELLDDQGKPSEAVAVAQKLAANPDVIAVIGPSSTASCSAAIPTLEKAKITAISPSASTPTLVTQNKFMYLVSLPNSVYGPWVPEYAVKKMGAKSLAMIYVKDDFGEAVTKEAKGWAEKNNIKVTGEASYSQGTRDFKSQLTSLLASKPGAILLNTHYTEGALITKQARDLGFGGALVAQGTNVYPQFIKLAGDRSEGVVGWVEFLPSLEDEATKKAVAKFKKAIGKEPLTYHIMTYDAVNILASGIRTVGNTEDRDALTRAVGKTKNHPGIVGRFGFDADRLPEKDIFWTVVKNGNWVVAN